MNKVKIAVVGSGPGGLSAAAHAAELDVSHALFESTAKHSNTIQAYQKGKHVMAEPGILPLRSPLEFDAGTREAVLDAWEHGLAEHKVDVRYESEVTAIEGGEGDFKLTIKGGEKVAAEYVILGIGVQGNPRKLGVEGEDLPLVQYTLDDPDEYNGETIVVVGAGDAAIENAVALAKNNDVFIINRRDEFARAKDGNNSLILRNIDQGKVQCYYKSNPARVAEFDGDKPYILTLKTEGGEAEIPCDRIIARLGAVPQRKFVESFGVKFANDSPTALPELSPKYESNVPGLYIIGALGGYPLIKQAMNQGYEVVEYILGNDIQPADTPLLEERFKSLPFSLEVDQVLDLMQERVPMFGEINPLLFREFMLESQVHAPAPGDIIFKKNDYTNTFFTVLAGEVKVDIGRGDQNPTVKAGMVFGEQGLISGRRRNATIIAGDGCVLVETPRRTMIKLINSNESIQRGIDEIFVIRAIQSSFAPNTPIEELVDVVRAARINSYGAGEYIYKEGDEGDELHLIRVGSVTISRDVGGRDVVLAYMPAGNYIGELGLMGNRNRMDTARASVRTETISISSDSFLQLLEKEPTLKEQVQEQVRSRLTDEARMAAQPKGGDVLSFFMQQGLGEGTDVLIIDEALCVGCNNCEKACAETHGGTSRLDREAGASYAQMHVPISCRHCEHPHCMKDCPPDAIHRSSNGEVFIDESCIGCGNCVSNCPYGVIHLAYKPPAKPGLWSWLLTGAGSGPGEVTIDPEKLDADAQKKAVKCDMCKDLPGGSACVRACPTGAAIRINPEQFVDLVNIA